MADRGTLTIAGGTYPITAMRKSDDVIWHVLDLGGREAPPVGAVAGWNTCWRSLTPLGAVFGLVVVLPVVLRTDDFFSVVSAM